MPKSLPYNPALKHLARQLRNNMTLGEVLLWNRIKNNKLSGVDFDRQRCIDNYIVDFYAKELMLAIEIDGKSHDGDVAFQKDEVRQQRLESLGVRFVRFTESEIKYDIENVLRTLEHTIAEIVIPNSNF